MRTLLSAPPTGRVNRYPKHTFNVIAKPFTLQPVGFARVLPGETLHNIKFEDRVSPIRSLIPLSAGKPKRYFSMSG